MKSDRTTDAQDTPRYRAVDAVDGSLRPALAELRARGRLTDPCGLTIRLAQTFGFCQGVQSAVARALRAAEELEHWQGPAPRPRIFLTGEIIHNPSTNERMRRAGIRILPTNGAADRLSVIRASDWVIVPAFGNPIEEARALERIGCRIIDTTCGWVRRTWRTVERFGREGLTTVIHGKVEHEETRATASRTTGPYVIVRNRREAEQLAAAVRREAPDGAATTFREAFAAAFAGTCSPGFDPERDLDRLGLVNQTTMLSSETEAIGDILAAAVRVRRGEMSVMAGATPPDLRLCTEDTFCPATQERQDAVRRLLAEGDLDAMLVVGGFRSSNTAHLAALAAGQTRVFHIEDAECLIDGRRIRRLAPGSSEPEVVTDWLPPAPGTIGVTAGASTPDPETDRVCARLLALCREVKR